MESRRLDDDIDARAVRAALAVLVCPICGGPFDADMRTLRCPRRHAFDRAREGYYHLLPASGGKAAVHGDTREMVRARRRVFERGLYEPLAKVIEERVVEERVAQERVTQELLADERAAPELAVLDVGCGEGYYVGRVARAMAERAPSTRRCCIGVDLSKDALRLAARAHRDVCFIVNDVRRKLTVAEGSVDVLLDVFAPRNAAEFARVVRANGLLIVAIPQERHLRELRERLPLLGIEAGKRGRTIEQLGFAFRLAAAHEVEYRRELAGGDVVDLLTMTPNAWHLDRTALEAVAGWSSMNVTFAMEVLCLRRRAGGAKQRG